MHQPAARARNKVHPQSREHRMKYNGTIGPKLESLLKPDFFKGPATIDACEYRARFPDTPGTPERWGASPLTFLEGLPSPRGCLPRGLLGCSFWLNTMSSAWIDGRPICCWCGFRICTASKRCFGYLKAIWLGISGPNFDHFSTKLGPQTVLDRRGSSCSAGCTTNQPRRPIF
jgi:hypothetical protein